MLSSKQIEIFYEIYKNTSITAAAEKLEVSQPSVSKTLAGIEKVLGFLLFVRKGKKLYPTSEARELYEQASIITSQLKNFNYKATTYRSKSVDFINIGTTPSLAETIVPSVIKDYLDVSPLTRFNLINLNSIDLIEDRYKPDIDLTICFNGPEKKSLKSTMLKKGVYKLVSPKSYNLPQEINLKDIVELPYIGITNLLSNYSKNSMLNYFLANDLQMSFCAKSDSYSAALSMVEKGIGLSILDDLSISKADLEKVNISKIVDEDFEYKINVFIKKDLVKNESIDFFNYLSGLKV